MTAIPRVFHRVWFGPPPPERFRRNGESWLQLNPGWTMTEWTDSPEAGGMANFAWMENYDLICHAPKFTPPDKVERFRSNLARYEILLRHGGVYLDHDFRALRPLEPVLRDPAGREVVCFVVRETERVISNGIMGATPGHLFMRKLVRGVAWQLERPQIKPETPSWITTGPVYLTAMAHSYLTRVPKNLGDVKNPADLDILPAALFYPYHHTNIPVSEAGRRAASSNTIAEHEWYSITERRPTQYGLDRQTRQPGNGKGGRHAINRGNA
jgi:mannosyltransferase OCH1-like enzyme